MNAVDAVVLHPSLGRPAADFDPLARTLEAAGFGVLAVDPQGIGASASDVASAAATLHDLAGFVAERMDAAGLGAAHLVGHALGNRVMRCLAADHPDRVRSITLLAAGGSVKGDAAAHEALLSCFDETLPEAQHVQAIRTAFFAPGHEVPASWRTGWFADVAVAQGAAVRRTPVGDWWDGGDAPMLVVQGLQDRIAPPGNGRRLRAERPRTTLVEIDHAGHALLPEQPEAVAEAVLAFLSAVEPAPDG